MEVKHYNRNVSAKEYSPPRFATALLGLASIIPGCSRFIEGEYDYSPTPQGEATIDLREATLPKAEEASPPKREEATSPKVKELIAPRSEPKQEREKATSDRTIKGTSAGGREFKLEITASEYERYASTNGARNEADRVTEEFCSKHLTPTDPTVKELAEALSSGAKSKEDAANYLLTWVRENITYIKESGDYHQYPVETLYLGQGDGEDAAYLYASMTQAVGSESILIHLHDHIAVGVTGKFTGSSYQTRGKDFFFAEPAANPELKATERYKVGVVPTKYSSSSAQLYDSKVDAQFEFRDSKNKRFEMTIPYQLLNQYGESELSRCCVPIYDAEGHWRYVTPKDQSIKMIAEWLTDGLQTSEEKAEALLDFVQKHIDYTEDTPNKLIKDYWQFPAETLARKKGDCEDSSYLYAAMLRSIGIECALFRFPNHIAVGVVGAFSGASATKDGKIYYFAETTSDYANIGDYSDSYETSVFVLQEPAKDGGALVVKR